MTAGGNCSGVILLERDRGDAFDDQTIELLEAVAALVGPALLTKSETDKLITGRAVRSAGSGLRALFGPRRPAVKIAAVAICATAAYLALAEGDFRISAKAVVEGAVQRAAVAPFDVPATSSMQGRCWPRSTIESSSWKRHAGKANMTSSP